MRSAGDGKRASEARNCGSLASEAGGGCQKRSRSAAPVSAAPEPACEAIVSEQKSSRHLAPPAKVNLVIKLALRQLVSELFRKRG